MPRKRITFPCMGQHHQMFHALPIAAEIARRHPDIAVHVAGATPAHADFARRLLARHAPELPITVDTLRCSLFDRTRLALKLTSVTWKKLSLVINRDYFRGFDAVIAPERSILFLKRLRLPDTRLVWTRHGAGDRAKGFCDDVHGFDYVLLAGDKIEQRLLERNLIRPGDYCAGVYAKFDWTLAAPPPAKPLFDNDRPTVLYNPHFVDGLSSWPRWGRLILDRFAKQDRYNLIFAPHVRLFDPVPPRVLQSFERFQGLPHLHIDLGSERSIDMSYSRYADLYLGDVSSQVAEFLYAPRPCVFLNAHGVDWRDNPDYRFWHLGPVLERLVDLDTTLDAARVRYADFQPAQERYFRDSFGIPAGTRTAARGADAIAGFLDRVPVRPRHDPIALDQLLT